jgi:hypothetical protein
VAEKCSEEVTAPFYRCGGYVVFSRRENDKKIADAVLRQLEPLLNVVERFAGVKPPELTDDQFVLGFVCGDINVEMMHRRSRTRAQRGDGFACARLK